MRFKLGSQTTLNEAASGVPKMGETLQGWFQPLTFILITKAVRNYINVESEEEIRFRGVWQPYSAQQMNTLPTGLRKWRWFTVHAEISLQLKIDDIVKYKGSRYRVASKLDYAEYDYLEYHLVEDYQS